MKKTALYTTAFLVLATSCLRETINITPSGRLETREYDFSNFTEVEIGSVAKVEFIQSDEAEYMIIEADDNMFPHLIIEQRGKRVRVRHEPISTTRRTPTINITVVYKDLRELRLLGASKSNFCNDSGSLDDLKIDLSGASKLTGNLHANKVEVTLSGASNFDGELHANQGHFSLSGASEMSLCGACASMVLRASGASSTHCFGLISEHLDATISGASTCRHTVTDTLKVTLSGASTLIYDGSPTVLRSDVSGASSLRVR